MGKLLSRGYLEEVKEHRFKKKKEKETGLNNFCASFVTLYELSKILAICPVFPHLLIFKSIQLRFSNVSNELNCPVVLEKYYTYK